MLHSRHLAGIYELAKSREQRRSWESVLRARFTASYIYNVKFLEQPDRFVLTVEDEDGWWATVLHITQTDEIRCETVAGLELYYGVLNPSLRALKINQVLN